MTILTTAGGSCLEDVRLTRFPGGGVVMGDGGCFCGVVSTGVVPAGGGCGWGGSVGGLITRAGLGGDVLTSTFGSATEKYNSY